MRSKKLPFLICIVLVSLTAMSAEAAPFASNLEEAKKILATKGPESLKSYKELMGENAYGEPYSIVRTEPMQQEITSGGKLKVYGSVYVTEDGKLGLQVRQDALPLKIAVVLSHEMTHIAQQIQYIKFLKENRTIGHNLLMAAVAYKSGKIKEFNKLNPEVTQVFLKQHFCAEFKAYSHDFILAKEGLPLSHGLTYPEDIPNFVYKNYISLFDVDIKGSINPVVEACTKYADFKQYMEAVYRDSPLSQNPVGPQEGSQPSLQFSGTR